MKYIIILLFPLYAQGQLEVSTGIRPSIGLHAQIWKFRAGFISEIPHVEEGTYFGIHFSHWIQVGVYYILESTDKTEYTKGLNYLVPMFGFRKEWDKWFVELIYLEGVQARVGLRFGNEKNYKNGSYPYSR